MDKLFCLDNRLMMCASFVPKGARLADIGTDHAYLPVWLLKQNLISYAIASDVNCRPLQAGKATAEKYQAENIDFRLGSGLETITEADDINCIVIAGMGGELISELLSKSPLVRKKNIRLILQPMTKPHKLIKYLYSEGFEISEQKTCKSHGKHYTVMTAVYSGNKQKIDEVFSYTGKLDTKNDCNISYLEGQIKNLEKQGKGDFHYNHIAEKIKELIHK